MFAPPAFAPAYAPPYAGQPAPQPAFGRPALPPMAAPVAQRPALPPAAVAQQPLPAPRFRAQAPEEPAVVLPPAPVAMPSPEQLGVALAAPAGGVDWTATHQRLDRLGATCFHREK